MAINSGKVVVGGLAAGVVMNVIDFLANNFLLQNINKAEFDRLNPALWAGMMSGATIGKFVVIDFVMGIVLVYTYAAMRPRFGPGPGTAMRAALVVWTASILSFVIVWAMGIFSSASILANGTCALVNILIATYVGAMLYKED